MKCAKCKKHLKPAEQYTKKYSRYKYEVWDIYYCRGCGIAYKEVAETAKSDKV